MCSQSIWHDLILCQGKAANAQCLIVWHVNSKTVSLLDFSHSASRKYFHYWFWTILLHRNIPPINIYNGTDTIRVQFLYFKYYWSIHEPWGKTNQTNKMHWNKLWKNCQRQHILHTLFGWSLSYTLYFTFPGGGTSFCITQDPTYPWQVHKYKDMEYELSVPYIDYTLYIYLYKLDFTRKLYIVVLCYYYLLVQCADRSSKSLCKMKILW